MRKWIALSMTLFILFTVITGCGVKEISVEKPVKTVEKEDLSIYAVKEPVKEEPKPVPYDPSLDYIDTAYFSKLMEAESVVSARKTYAEFPPEWSFVLIDTRPQKVFEQGHINGSINISASEFTKYEQLLPADKNKLLVFYCGGIACGLSKKAALMAKDIGYTNIKVYQEGIPAWEKAGNYLVVTPDYVHNKIMTSYVKRPDYPAYLLIDARPYPMYFEEHIPNAIQMDDSLFTQKYLGVVPKNKNSEIIVYCGGFSCIKSHQIAEDLVANAYTNVKVMAGGIPLWKSNKLPTFGAKTAEVSFDVNAGLVDRSLTTEQFSDKLEHSTKVVVIDVRTLEERSHGYIIGSIHIQDSKILADPQSIISKLPKDKETTLLVHCASGARASGVVDKIADLGYKNTYYLNHSIFISSDGSYRFN